MVLCTHGTFWARDLKLPCTYYITPRPGNKAKKIYSRSVRAGQTDTHLSSAITWTNVGRVVILPHKQPRASCFCWRDLTARCFWGQGEVTAACCGGCCWHSSPEPTALHRGLINRLCKALRNFLGGSRGGRVVFNIIILHCYHNDCFERFDLLFQRDFLSDMQEPTPRGRKSLLSERLPVTAQGRDKPLFYFASLPALQADDLKDLKPLSLSISEVKRWLFFFFFFFSLWPPGSLAHSLSKIDPKFLFLMFLD